MITLRCLALFAILNPSFGFTNNIIRGIFKQLTSMEGVKWPERTHPLRHMNESKHYDKSVVFPEYYLKNFHAYDGGNLNPLAAKEAAAASEAIYSHHYENKSGKETSELIRGEFNKDTMKYWKNHVNNRNPSFIVDVGCGIGISTSFIRKASPESFILGIDLSPFFLHETEDVGKAYFMHRDIGDTRIMSNSVDIVSISYVLHELPVEEIQVVLKETNRILKKGGILAILDINISSSSEILKFVFDKTEPYMNEYMLFSKIKETFLKGTGFSDIIVRDTMPKTTIVLCHS